MADNNTIARPYAQAAFELANEAGDLVAWSESLEVARALLADGQVVTYLGDPAFSNAQRLEFLTGLFAKAKAGKISGKDKQGTNFLKLLLEYGRIAVLPEIAAHFEVLKAQIENIVDVTVTSAQPISKKQQDTISKALRERLGRDVNLATQIDESLIGGLIVKVGSRMIDTSIRSKLSNLQNSMKEVG